MKGRKPTSKRLRILKGTAKGAMKYAEPRPAKGRWKAPSWLGKEGKEFHKKNFPLAKSMNSLTEIDRDTWFVLAQTYHRVRQCHSELDKDGLTITDSRGAIKKHPATAVLNQLMTHYRALCDQFGLNPTGRERLGLEAPKTKEQIRRDRLMLGELDDDLLSG